MLTSDAAIISGAPQAFENVWPLELDGISEVQRLRTIPAKPLSVSPRDGGVELRG